MTIKLSVYTRNNIVNSITGKGSILYPMVGMYGVYGTYGSIEICAGTPVGPDGAYASTPIKYSRAYNSGGLYSVSANAVQAGGQLRIQSPSLLNVTGTSAGQTSTYGRLTYPQFSYIFAEGSVGLAGSGADFIVDTLAANVIPTLSSATLLLPYSTAGSVSLNEALRNAIMCDIWYTGYASSTGTVSPVSLGVSGFIDIYSGTPPAFADMPATGTLLATATLATTQGTCQWVAASAGAAQLAAAINTANAVAAGTAGYFRWRKGAYILQGICGAIGSGAHCELSNVASTVGTPMTISTLTVAAPSF